uniref:CST complex subunit CTC1 n=1 Tax=Calidris pygmaea TaxID=425635 RepID=A0A8C3JVA7_9CHAR
ARDFARRALPAREGPGGPEPPLEAVLRCLRSAGGGDLPLGYSFISISDLQHQQCMPCCSHLTWSTNEFKEWAHQGQGVLPMQSTLPRAYLILVGYLTDGRQEDKEKLVDGCLYLKDSTGIIPCELLHFELEWLESLFLFPSWSYIPQTEQSTAGYVEILVDPVPVNLPEEVPDSIPVTYPASAEPLLSSSLRLGHRYTITGLSISSLKKSGQRIFVTSASSCLLPYCAEQARELPLDSLGLLGSWTLYTPVTFCLLAISSLKLCVCVSQLIDVHLLQKPLISFPFIVLGACLSSTVVLKSFSRLSTPYQPPASSGNLYLQLLFRYNLGMPVYLWLVTHVLLCRKFCPETWKHCRDVCLSTHQNPRAAEKFIVPLLQAVVPDREKARDIYNEILAKTHQCPLQKVSKRSVSFCHVAEQKSWEGFSPSQLLSPLEAQHMGSQELNRRLAWSYCTLSAESFQPRLRRLGMEMLNCHCLLAVFYSLFISSAPFSDVFAGSLLQVENYQLIVERFLQTDFPSWKQLANLEHVREKKTRQVPLFSAQLKSSLCSSTAILDYGKATFSSGFAFFLLYFSFSTFFLTFLITFSLFLSPPLPHQALLIFMGKSLRWFPFLHLDGLYRFIVPRCSVRQRLCCCFPARDFLLNCMWDSWCVSFCASLGSLLASDHSVKLSISVAPGSPVVMDIYIAATYLQHLWGLLPGAKIFFQNLERKISRYPSSHIPIFSSLAGETSSPSLVFISNLQPHLPQARILCHLSCVLTLSLQWVCSLCSSIFKESACSLHRVLVEDGTGEAFVLCRNQHVAAMLGLNLLEWEALQNCVQNRGRVSIQHGEATGTGVSGGSLPPSEPEDFVACYLRSLCRSPLICRPILLDFSLDRKPSKILQPGKQLRNFRCGEVEFVSQVGPRLSLLCLNVEEVEQGALSYLNSERIRRTSSHC